MWQVSAQDSSALKNTESHGSLGLKFGAYSNDFNTPNDSVIYYRSASASPFSYIINGNYSLYFKKQDFKLPFSFVVSDQHRSFRQPFNQFNVSPVYKKWFRGYLGYNNLSFSPFTLGGATFLGAGIDLNPGMFRFGAIYGRFNKAISVDSTKNESEQPVPSYSRNGYGLKLGIGNQKNYVDLITFHAKDKLQSLDSETADSTLKPQENLCIGISSHQMFSKHVTWDLDFSGSALTRDTRFDSVNTEVKALRNLQSIFETNISTTFAAALQTSVYIKMKHFSVKLGYRRIDADYTSFGAYFFPTDLENFSFAPRFSFLNNKLQLSINSYYQHNNIRPISTLFLNDSAWVKKKASTARTIKDVNTLTWNVFNAASQSFGIDFQNSIFSNTEKVLRDADTLTLGTINTLNINFGITPRFILTRNNLTHSITVVANMINSVDYNPVTAPFDNGHTFLLNAMYSVFIDSCGLTLSIAGNNYNSDIGTNKATTTGGTIGASKLFLDDQVMANLSASFNGEKNGGHKSTAFVLNAGGTYQPTIHHQFALNLNYSKSGSKDDALTPFFEFKMDVAYVYKF